MSIYDLMVKEQEKKYKLFVKEAEEFLEKVGKALTLEGLTTIDNLEEIGKFEMEIPMENVSGRLSKEEITQLFPKYLETYLENEFSIRTYASWLYAKVEFKEDSFVISADLSNAILGLRGDEEGSHRDLVLKAIKEMRKNFFNADSYSKVKAEIEVDSLDFKLNILAYSLRSIGFKDVNIELKEKVEEDETQKIVIEFLVKYNFKD